MDLPILLGELFTIIEGNSTSLPYITYCVCDAEAEAMVIQCNLVLWIEFHCLRKRRHCMLLYEQEIMKI